MRSLLGVKWVGHVAHGVAIITIEGYLYVDDTLRDVRDIPATGGEEVS